MKTISYLQSLDELNTFIASDIDELIISCPQLSRFGKISLNEINLVAQKVREAGISPVFEWDILMTEKRFHEAVSSFMKVDLSLFDAVRVQDPGALNLILEKFDIPIQLILENGNHNLEGIKRWADLVGDRLSRLVLSIELSRDTIKEYCNKLSCPIEFLGLGRILLFYTPRNLVTPLIVGEDQSAQQAINSKSLEVLGSSEESPHSGFPIVENIHGTFMFNTKDHCLLENIDELIEFGLDTIRFDLRFLEELKLIAPLVKLVKNYSKDTAIEIKDLYPATVIRGFYNVNKSDVLFKKLKNKRIERSDSGYLGDVVEVNKKNHIGIMVRSKNIKLRPGMEITYNTPDGRSKNQKINKMINSQLLEVIESEADSIVFVPHVSGISIKTAVYLNT